MSRTTGTAALTGRTPLGIVAHLLDEKLQMPKTREPLRTVTDAPDPRGTLLGKGRGEGLESLYTAKKRFEYARLFNNVTTVTS